MTENLFDQNSTEVKEQPTPSEATNDQGAMSEWVGEGKKYSTTDELVKAFSHSQEFIEKLKSENAELKQAKENQESVEEKIARLQAEQERLMNAEPAQQAEATFDRSVVHEEIEAYNSLQKAKQNEEVFSKRFNELHGEKAGEVLATKAKELGVSVQEVQAMVQKSPTAAFNMLGITQTSKPVSSQPTGVNTAGLGLSNQESEADRIKATIKELFNTDPARYQREYPKLQEQLIQAMNKG